MLWRSSYMIYLGVLGVAILLLLISRVTAIGGLIYLLLGIIIGIAVRAILSYRQTIHLWPVLERIIDWDKVDTLLQTQPGERTGGGDPTK